MQQIITMVRINNAVVFNFDTIQVQENHERITEVLYVMLPISVFY